MEQVDVPRLSRRGVGDRAHRDAPRAPEVERSFQKWVGWDRRRGLVGYLPKEDRDGEAERERKGGRGLDGPRAEAGDGTGLQGRGAEGFLEAFCQLQLKELRLI